MSSLKDNSITIVKKATSALALSPSVGKKITLALTLLVAMLLGSYIFFVYQSVVNASVAERLEVDIDELTTEVSQLEFSYISKRNDITFEYAMDKGFLAISPAHFIELNQTSKISRAQYEN